MVVLRRFRLQHGMSQRALAEAIGDYERASIANLEAGRAQPSLAVAQKLEDIFHVSIRTLLATDTEPSSTPLRTGRPRKTPQTTLVPVTTTEEGIP